MNKYLTFLLVITLLNLSNSAVAKKPSRVAKNMFKTAVAASSVPGISVAVADKSGLLWAKGFGFADLENNIAMKPQTKLRIGSIAKVITAAGLMRLYEQGKIDLDADIRYLVSAWPDKHQAISLNHLTSHTSGIRHYQSYAEYLANIEYETTTAALDIFKDDPLLFTPGSNFKYSTFGWTLVSAAMEQADGQKTFKKIIQSQVLEPLNMANTTFDDNSPLISHRQRPYSFANGQLINSPEVNSSYKYAGGGFLSTPSDVVTFAMAHTHTDYLNAETLALLFKDTERTDGTKNGVGIGWFVGFDFDLAWAMEDEAANKDIIRIMQAHPTTVMHSGGSVGGTSMMLLCLDHDHAVAVVKNVDGDESADVFELALKTLDIFYQQKEIDE